MEKEESQEIIGIIEEMVNDLETFKYCIEQESSNAENIDLYLSVIEDSKRKIEEIYKKNYPDRPLQWN